jgi:ATP-dependent Lhr-like helicase
MELRGEVRGGRFVGGFAGEQFALPSAVELLRKVRREPINAAPTDLHPSDPLNYQGVLTPAPLITPPARHGPVLVSAST